MDGLKYTAKTLPEATAIYELMTLYEEEKV